MTDEKKLIEETARLYAESLILYGVDITKKWETATSQAAALQQAYMRGKSDAFERIDVPDTNVGEWIPCSERLPETAGYYLCSLYYPIPPYDLFHPENDTYVHDVSVKKFDGTTFTKSVIAWQPLPEPYKKDGAE